ncbi:MAG: NAD(P)/FAD-dependent oxidoreductase [Candidatus Bathyarchaeota archaeon]|nr:MAG: NAD(P)/FAD-dependent oxidoreductase [Candidatus Bathyarchaeota archaeon]
MIKNEFAFTSFVFMDDTGMENVDIIVIGAGVVGLAIASEITSRSRELYILEKEADYGLATSSRNSEVIHAGIYYPHDSLKAKLCVQGNPMIYQLCEENNIAYKRTGKIIVATQEEEVKELENLLRQGQHNGAKNLEMIDEEKVHEFEPRVKGVAALYSPSTGILDVHSLMKYYYKKIKQNSTIDPLILNTKVVNLTPKRDGYIVTTKGQESFSLKTTIVINAAGLYADKIAEMAGIEVDKERYQIHWCKGDYFSLRGKPPVAMLVYPAPPADAYRIKLTGIHAIPDLIGRLKFGPNAYYVNRINYNVESNKEDFWKAITSYLPSIQPNDLHPDMSGIRPKLQRPGESFRDFIIQHEEKKGFSGLINLIGIESPGLTCSPAIAKMVKKMVHEILK